MRKHVRNGSRGAALVETALSLSLVLLFLAGSIQVMMVAYFQITLDAATFTHNRAIALGVPTGTTASNVDYPFSKIIATSPVSVNATPAPQPTAAFSGVLYGSASQGSRNGGVTQLFPLQSIATEEMTTAFATVTSSAVEALVKDVCPHFCMVNGGFGTAGALASATSYFGSVDDNSPYFGGFGFMETCGSSDYDSLSETNNLAYPHQWDTCPNQIDPASGADLKILWRGFSAGPQLTAQNYQMQNPGLTPEPSVPGYITTAGTFFVSWCHRRFYALIANQLAAFPVIPASDSVSQLNFTQTMFHGYATDGKFPAGVLTPADLIYAIGTDPDAVLYPPHPPGWDDTIMFLPAADGAHPYEGNENEGWGCWDYE